MTDATVSKFGCLVLLTNPITEAEQTVIFEVRYCSELKNLDSTHFRILFHGDSYNIQSVDMMNYQRKKIRIRCQKEVR